MQIDYSGSCCHRFGRVGATAFISFDLKQLCAGIGKVSDTTAALWDSLLNFHSLNGPSNGPSKLLYTTSVFSFFKDCMMGHQPNGIDLDESFGVLLVEPSLNIHA